MLHCVSRGLTLHNIVKLHIFAYVLFLDFFFLLFLNSNAPYVLCVIYQPLVSLWVDNTGVVLDVKSLMLWFTVSPSNYSSKLLSFTWHFLTVAPDEIAVYHFTFYASVLFCYVGHHIPSSCLTFSPQLHEIRCACFPRSLLCRGLCGHCDLAWYSMSSRKVKRSCLLSRVWVLPLWSWHVIFISPFHLLKVMWLNVKLMLIPAKQWVICGLNVFRKDMR